MNAQNIGVVLSDFDGTLTDSATLSRDFKRGYLGELAHLTGRSVYELEREANRVERDMKAHPQAYDWNHLGNIVSTAVSDPSLRFIGITERILDTSRCYPTGAERDQLLHELFVRHYPATSAFRPHAAEVLSTSSPVYIVSNSSTARVASNIERLSHRSLRVHRTLRNMRGRVHGNARKQMIDDSFTVVPATLDVEGLHRPVLLRRKFYYEAIVAILAELHLTWNDTLVMGDNFELDLALPMHLGAHAVLVANPFTPSWEIAFMRTHPRGHVVTSLREMLALR